MNGIKLLIGESHELVSCGLRCLFEDTDDIQLVEVCDSAAGMYGYLAGNEVDVILMDYTSEGFSVDDIRKVKRRFGHIKVVAISPQQSSLIVLSAIRAGIDAYVKTDCSLDEIVNAVLSVNEDGQFFCGEILEKLHREEVDLSLLNIDTFSCSPVIISDRENEVITMIAEGYTNVQIAEKLFLSSHTVNTHRKNIMQKLGVKNTASVVMYAVKSGLVSPNKYLFAPTGSK